MIQSTLFEDNTIADIEFLIINEREHINTVWEIMLPELEIKANKYVSRIQACGGAQSYIEGLKQVFLAEQHSYSRFFISGWNRIGENYKEFKRNLRLHCPAFAHALQSRTRVLNDWKASFNSADPEKLFHVINNIYEFNAEFNTVMTEERIRCIQCWEDNRLQDLIDKECYLNRVVGPGMESAILYHLNPRVFPGVYRLGIFSLFFLSGHKQIEMPSKTSEFIMVKDAVRSRTGIIETDHNFFFPYQVYAYYTLKIYGILCDAIQKYFSIQFSNRWRYVLTSDFFSMIVDDNKEMIQTLMGNDDILKYEMFEYY